jgi:Cu/Ag efflux protein CusF
MFSFRPSIALAALAVLALGPAAQAADLQGVVKELNSAAGILTLEDGTELRVPNQDLMDKLHEGDKVLVTFEEKDGAKVISSVEVTGQ